MTVGELRLQVGRALSELREYEAFALELKALDRSLAAGDFDDSLLQSAQLRIPHPLRSYRGVIPADDSLKDTRLLINELNHIIKMRRKKGA
jgi:hypothetical protein